MKLFSIRAFALPVLISFAAPLSAQACSCLYAGDFADYADGKIVVHGEIQSYGPRLGHDKELFESMNVKVIDVIKGTYQYERIELLGDTGNLCRSYVSSQIYPLGSEHLFVVFTKDKEQDLGGCGEVSVRIINGTVKGVSFDGEVRQAYATEYDTFVNALAED